MRPLLFCALLLGALVASAQQVVPILERKISIELNDESLPSALDRIGRLAGFSFSYNSSIISVDRMITVKVTDKSVREVLNEIFKGTIQYKEKAKHVILTQAPLSPKAGTSAVTISGYVEDMESRERITDASVYEKESLTSTVTDQYGFYKIKLDNIKDKTEIKVSKKSYRDTAVLVSPGSSYLNISMKHVAKDSIAPVAKTEVKDSVKQEKKKVFELPYASDVNVRNIHDTLYREAQISFLPFLGSNGKLSGNVINDYSFNILGGYSLGTRIAEVGGFINIDRGDVSWFQLAGFGNLVGGNVKGLQASGFFNVNGGETKAVQLSGFANTNFGETRGIQVAGFANTNLKSMHGVQVAGFSNFSQGPGVGVQAAGFANVQVGEYKGSQFAGMANINTRRINGTQVAGFANIGAGHVGGSQVSGFFNYARSVKGTQIGIFNYADSLGGVPIGLVSIVRHGYHKLEVSGDEVFLTNVSFRTGVRSFYNILLAGIKPNSGPTVWTYGYGVGSARRIAGWLYLNVDITSQQVNTDNHNQALRLLNKVHLGFDFQLGKKFSIYAGGTLNGYLTEAAYSDDPILFTDSNPHLFYNSPFRGSDYNLKMWFGWKVGLRFF